MTTEMLSVMAKVCQKMLEIPELRSRLQYEETELFILRVMVAIIILYDHVHPTGAFAKGKTLINFWIIIPSIFTVQILCWSIHYLVNNSCLTSYLIHFELVQLIYWCFNRNSCGREGLRQSTTWTRKVPRRRYFFINY